MNNRITFYGAARTVTGSKHLIESNGQKILVDCGMFQGSKELRDRNRQEFPFAAHELDAVVLTHAHQDHIGLLPVLGKKGYKGPIYSTKATRRLSSISLADSGRLQEEDAYQYNKRHDQKIEPLYTEDDAYAVMKQFKIEPYDAPFGLPGGISARYIPAGHIIGSAYVEIEFKNGQTLLMGGDLGRWDTPIINDPELVERADYVVVESTYGDRLHSKEDPKEKIAMILQDAIKNASCVLIPSFAIGRTQELLYYISCLQSEGRLGRIPVYVDSPMATSVSDIYGDVPEEWDEEMVRMMKRRDNPVEPEGIQMVRDRNMSKALNAQSGPMVVIAGSGMANGGRILHHLLHRLSDPSTVVLFTGYQAHETLGRRLLEGAPMVRIFGQEVEVHAKVDKVNALSAHADQGELLRWLRGFQSPPKKLFVVHGEPEVQDIFAEKVRQELGWNVVIPEQGESFELV